MLNARHKQLAELVKTADYQALRKFFEGTSADERKTFAKTSIAAYKSAAREWTELSLRAALNSIILTCDDEDIPDNISFWYAHSHTFDLTLIKPLIKTISPRLIEMLVEQERIGSDSILMLAEEGLITTPDTDQFIALLMKSPPRYKYRSDFKLSDMTVGNSFLDHYVWRMFEVEGSGDSSLAAHDKFTAPEKSWNAMLLKAEKDGDLNRERALDLSLDALDRGFAQFRAGWHSRFHEDLQPTISERFQRKEKYAHLLGSPIPPTVTMALNALIEVSKEYPLPVQLILQNIEAPLGAKGKSTALSALKLIDATINSNPAEVAALCGSSTIALLHRSPEVQKAALKVILKHNERIDEPLRSQITQYVDALSPSAQKLIAEALKQSDNEQTYVDATESSANYEYLTTVLPSPLETSPIFQPIQSVEELIASCVFTLEHLDNVLEIERILDAAVRLSDRSAADFSDRLAPILKRAKALQKTYEFQDGVLVVLNFIVKWLGGDIFEHARPTSTMSKFIERRLKSILTNIDDANTLPLLSIPTYQNGFVDPSALVKRWQQWNDQKKTPSLEEQTIALLRLPLKNFDFSNVDLYSGEFWNAARYAAGQGNETTATSANRSLLWTAAEAVRTPPLVAASFKLDSDPLFVDMGLSTTARCALFWLPAVRNIFVATGIRPLALSIDYSQAVDHSLSVYVEPLLDKSFKFDRRAYCVLAAANISQSAGISGIARDILISRIEERSLDVDRFAAEVNKLLFNPYAKMQRLISALSDVARVSPLHTNAIRQTLEKALTGGEKIPNGFSQLLEFFNELLHSDNSKITNAETVQFLSSIAKSGKTKKLVAELLAH